MNINELFEELKKRNISMSGRAISQIWGMDEASFSLKKRNGTQIKQKNIMQLEDALGIKLMNITPEESENNLERCYKPDIQLKRRDFSKRIIQIKKKNNLSDIQLSGLLDVRENELSDILSGKIQPDIKILDNLKQNFNVSIDWLLYGS